jgi:hypothetical protein
MAGHLARPCEGRAPQVDALVRRARARAAARVQRDPPQASTSSTSASTARSSASRGARSGRPRRRLRSRRASGWRRRRRSGWCGWSATCGAMRPRRRLRRPRWRLRPPRPSRPTTSPSRRAWVARATPSGSGSRSTSDDFRDAAPVLDVGCGRRVPRADAGGRHRRARYSIPELRRSAGILGPVFELEEFMSRRARRPTAFVSPNSNARPTLHMLEEDDASEYVIAT